MMQEFRYALIRFVPDRERMEPVNAGVIVQGSGRVGFKLQPGFARRKAVETEVWRGWRQFFDQEIHGDEFPLFQPRRAEAAFLRHLSDLCTGNVLVSKPLLHVAPEGQSFETTLQALYERLAAPAEESPQAIAKRPTARFRQIAQERRFERRGMRKTSFVHVDDESLWQAYRQVVNGRHIAIDKVEVGRQLHLTALEIQFLGPVIEHLSRFLGSPQAATARSYILFADILEHPFTEQTEEDFEDMKRLLGEYEEQIVDRGGRVVRRADEVLAVAEEIETSLDPIAVADDDED